ncbi:MAG: ribosome maturation factor RimP [Lachnospiraceae bacterium]|nr:ribosome maturation factor RimP [Lachnospiraceae bacterium]
MSKREEYEKKTEEFLLPILEELKFELWDVEYVKEGSDHYLRAYIDKEGGITIDDCVAVSRRLSDKLDETDLIPDAYILEVSSPGLGRTLKKDRDLEKSIGRSVDIKLYKAKENTKEYTGILKEYDKENINIENEEGSICFLRSEIASIKLTVEL